jgi:hypothetical protein
MTEAYLLNLMAVMPAEQREQVYAAIADWEEVKAKHGDAGLFAFALVALTFEMQKEEMS